MTVSSGKAPQALVVAPADLSSERELAVTLLFGPLADRVVSILRPANLPPPAIVLTHASVGLGAAWVLSEGALVLAALLLQLKTLLDNADGRLARTSGRVTLLGRYLDTEADFVVNAALFAALASVTGAVWLALASFCAVTLVLSVQFNLALLSGESGRGDEPPPAGGRAERAVGLAYRLVFEPQDRLVRAISNGRLGRIVSEERDPRRREAAALAYCDRATLTVLANLGLSTQLLALGVVLVLGVPVVYLWLVLASLALLPVLQLRRERLARRALRR